MNPIAKAIGILFGKDTDGAGAPKLGRRCEAGHLMDPNWKTCPYCAAEQRSQQQSAPVSTRRDTHVPTPGQPRPAGDRVTEPDVPNHAGFSASEGEGYVGSEDARRIAGILVTFTWKPQGELFIIREGKNYIGAGNIVSEESRRPCHIQIKTDDELSGEHALILCRQGAYDLVDQNSSNGTFLDGELVPRLGVELPNNAQIKTGKTVWTFLKVQAPGDTVVPVRPEPAARPGRGTTGIG